MKREICRDKGVVDTLLEAEAYRYPGHTEPAL